jgi:8-oxo-dGTP pyrophosphatase MutT (NUDIX family)
MQRGANRLVEIDKLAWLHLRNQQLLFARSGGKTIFYIPGGKREPGESDAAALIREIREELSVDLLPETLVHAGTFSAQADGRPDGTNVCNTCYFAQCIGEPRASAEIEELAWFDYKDRERCSPVAKLILDWLHSTGRIR